MYTQEQKSVAPASRDHDERRIISARRAESHERWTYTDRKSYLRSDRYGAAQIDRIFSGSRQTALQATAAASRRAS